jgi:hypothetical protein
VAKLREAVAGMRHFPLTVVLLFLLRVSADGATYYVSATQGNDANDGRATTSPWATIVRVNNHVFKPGDVVLFRRGDLWRETLRPASSGSELAPITFGAYGSGPKPVITGSDRIPRSAWKPERGLYFLGGLVGKPASVWRAGVRLKESSDQRAFIGNSDWRWNDGRLRLRSGNGPPADVEIQVREVNIDNNEQSHLVYQDLTLEHAREGLRLYAWSAIVRDITLQDSAVATEPSQEQGTMSAGVYASVHTGQLTGIVIRRNTFLPYPEGLKHWGVYLVRGASDFRIEDNTFGPAGEDAICIWHSSRGVIARNRGRGNGENTIDVKDSHDVRILDNLAEDDAEYNIVVHGVDQMDATHHIDVERNRCVRGGRGGRLTAGIALLSVKDVRVEGNTVEDARGEGIFVLDADRFRNVVSGNVIRQTADHRRGGRR